MENGFVQITDVGPRDGFQNVKKFIDTDVKLTIIDKLCAAGVRSMELTSFVSPKAIPQMADADTVARTALEKYPELRAVALVPNLRGAQNAWEAGIREIACVISASEAHNKANVNRTVAESVAGLAQIRAALPEVRIQLDIATAFGCPFAGEVPAQAVLDLIEQAQDVGLGGVTLCDTIGVANPAQVQRLLSDIRWKYPQLDLTLHFHNTRGMGLANIFAALELGLRKFETAVGGLGGCPFAPGADGNTATEDVVNMLCEMGYETGIDLDKYLEAVTYTQEHVDARLSGKLLGVRRSTCMNVSGRA